MDKPLFDRSVQTLLSEMNDPAERKTVIESALYRSPILEKIQWDGAARPFTERLVRQLDEFGTFASGKSAVVALLEAVRGGVGADRQKQIDDLIRDLARAVSDASAQRVFISYARPDQAAAERVEAALLAAGFAVFIDKTMGGGDWDSMIETALRQHDRMVLLLSTHSMPFRKEVHREWFYFDQNRKPIHPLYLADCDLHSRMYAYNFRDARADFDAALRQLIDDLRQPFQLLTDAAPTDPFDGCRRSAIAELSSRAELDTRFVQLTVLLDRGKDSQETRFIEPPDARRYTDLRTLLADVPEKAFVLLGDPGSGKSTLLRRLLLDHSRDRMTDGGTGIAFFAPLNSYRADDGKPLPDPGAWLNERWTSLYPNLPPLDGLLRAGRVLLLLDALNEMPHLDKDDYRERIASWQTFLRTALATGSRAVFSCRSLDYSAPLSSDDLPVRQVVVKAMSPDRIQEFLGKYVPDHAERVWEALRRDPKQVELFSTPYFLRLLCEQVERQRDIPRGRAALFTGFVRSTLRREIQNKNRLFKPDGLIDDGDYDQITQDVWASPYQLPEGGFLIPKLSELADAMQRGGTQSDGAQVRVPEKRARELLAHEQHAAILDAGLQLNVLDKDIARRELSFFHQLLQEFFAARRLAEQPDPALVRVAWRLADVTPTLEEALATLSDGDPLPLLPQTGWEETTLIAAAMSAAPDTFVRDLMDANLPLAGRAAAAPDVRVSSGLKRDLQTALIARTQDMDADVRARIAAGLALGELGDPRFERRAGAHGDYLLPPLVSIEGGTYPMGDDSGYDDDEKPPHIVDLDAFQIGMFPVTNAEYALFMEAGGYEDERWWDTDEAKAWLRGEGSTDGQKAGWRDTRAVLQSMSEQDIQSLVPDRITSEQANDFIAVRNLTDERFEQQLDEWFPSGQTYRQPEFWNDTRFNAPSQPVVGVTWFEARAYCNWLSANALPSPPTPLPQGERGENLTSSISPTRGEGNQERWLITPELAGKMTEIARRLRREATASEEVLWQALRNRRLDGRKFRRQEAVGAFVLDFYCSQERLAVEIDGGIHDLPEQQRADADRQTLLESLGIRFVRLSTALVERDLATALERIRSAFLPSPQTGASVLLPSPQTGEPDLLPSPTRGEGQGVRATGVRVFRLPTEAEFEAAARGKGGRKFPYGDTFDTGRCNTFESHLRRSTPVGIFDNATPEGAFDLTGNVYTWTTSIYDQDVYPYPYRADDGRESIGSNARRVLRGGSWRGYQYGARAASRSDDHPVNRYFYSGFRLVRAPSQSR